MSGNGKLPASRLASLFASGETTPARHLDELLARIERVNPVINALVCTAPDARDAARESAERHRRGEARGPLDGVPVAIKDNLFVRGLPTTWGSRAWRDSIAAEDDVAVERLRAAGAVIVGKTNVPEFTLDGYTANALFGVTRNPWDTRLTPGGSSGGAVAGVAAGLFPLALGTDGGGSIRRPASHTGLVGVKPSIGAVPRHPTLPQILLDYEVIGPIARTVEDAALLYNAVVGADARDRASLGVRAAPVALDAPRRGRILYVARFGDNPLDPEVEASVAHAAQALRALGHDVEEGPLPFDIAPTADFWPLLGQVGLAYVFDREPAAGRLAQQRFVELAATGRTVAAARYFAGIEAVRALRRDVAVAFERFDAIMTPSAAALPWPAEEVYPTRIAGRDVGPRGHAIYTGWVNASGHPAIALPCAPSRDGLPIGFQLVGRYADDALLFRIALQYERAAPFAQRWPALAEEST